MSDPLEHSGLDRADDIVPGLVLPEPLEHSVLVIPLEKGDVSVTDVTVLDPIEHSGVDVRTETISSERVLGRPQKKRRWSTGSSG